MQINYVLFTFCSHLCLKLEDKESEDMTILTHPHHFIFQQNSYFTITFLPFTMLMPFCIFCKR